MYRKERSQANKNKRGKISGASAPVLGLGHEPVSRDIRRSRRRLFIIIGIVVVIILGILAIPYYQNYIAPFNRTIITVDDIQISMRYFLDRTRLAGSDPMSMLQSLTNELVIKIMAPQYGIQVTDVDIDNELRSLASGGTDNISDVEFKEWYRQQLNDNKISDSQYREIISIGLLTSRLHEYLAERVPPTTEQVHLHVIVVGTYEEAQVVMARLQAGEDFSNVAREVSVDMESKDSGGDLGWLAPVTLTNYASLISALDVNEISAIIPYYSPLSTSTAAPDYYYIFMVSEKDSARRLDDDDLQIFKAMALDLWLSEEITNHAISYNFDNEIYAWLNWQLEKQ